MQCTKDLIIKLNARFYQN